MYQHTIHYAYYLHHLDRNCKTQFFPDDKVHNIKKKKYQLLKFEYQYEFNALDHDSQDYRDSYT